jgi:hypothetical protein
MAVIVCLLCWCISALIPSLRSGSGGKPVCTQPPVTRAELDAAHAAREQRIRREGLPYQGDVFASAYDEF